MNRPYASMPEMNPHLIVNVTVLLAVPFTTTRTPTDPFDNPVGIVTFSCVLFAVLLLMLVIVGPLRLMQKYESTHPVKAAAAQLGVAAEVVATTLDDGGETAVAGVVCVAPRVWLSPHVDPMPPVAVSVAVVVAVVVFGSLG